MKAMQLSKPAIIEENPLELVELPDPKPGPGQVRIKVSVCGLCHTDLHTVEGDLNLPKLPLVPGHEIVGHIDKVGEGVNPERITQRVGSPWLYSTCGECEFCAEGKENLCRNARFTGYHVDGGYAEYVIVPADSAYPLPEGIPDPQIAPLMCGGVIGYRALVLSEAKPGQTLGLYGFGNSAHVTIQIAVYLGMKVYVFSRTPANRQLAGRMGACWTGTAEDKPPEPLHSGIVFAPAGPLVPAALKRLRPGGTLALAGITMTDIPSFPYEILYEERTVRSVANSTHQDVRELLDYAGKIPIKTQVTEFPLEDANEVLRMMKESRIQGGAVLIP
ncbi:zinc-binding alcohol dehydrogenase family protein [candidate division WOR-3 bacterium]|uniref:alcohol dehydrogenase n=1 Tax=candidate division WOR-3 bacterium TaxID=2052148 RepID=A0A9D5K9B8_UNCW3|nr:zinc-binding alcohol dehydrogenase family protein [candidate division WOR-3 bacterium]MBD3364505.1 zinc-binding alcohol dehydrogenase family protein [candidate division WOR-3 bacterium]